MKLDVLAIGAHPDDIEIFCGGALAALSRQGAAVGLLHLTRGEAGTRGTPQIRADEAARAAARLGAGFCKILDLGDSMVRDDDRSRRAVLAEIRAARPRVLIAHLPSDDHPDHAATGDLAKSCWYLSGIRKALGLEGEPHRPAQLWFYPSHEHPSPRFVIPLVEADVVAKMEAIHCYSSQFESDPDAPVTRISQPRFLKSIEARLRFYGGLADVEFAEAFLSPKPLVLARPLAFLE